MCAIPVLLVLLLVFLRVLSIPILGGSFLLLGILRRLLLAVAVVGRRLASDSFLLFSSLDCAFPVLAAESGMPQQRHRM
jgi:hypothetical protein